MMSNVRIFPTPANVATAAAEFFVKITRVAVAKRGVCRVALSGGSTPKAMHQLLITEPFKSKVPWERLAIFWGDERCVPLDHPDSNYLMARETLLDFVPIPVKQIYPMPGYLDPVNGAETYQATLQEAFSKDALTEAENLPIFDLILLGMGSDGHTASLFPNSPLLLEIPAKSEGVLWVAPVFDSPKPPSERLTLTLPVINAARYILFLVTGGSKAPAFKAVSSNSLLKTKDAPRGYKPPAAFINPPNSKLKWLVDQATLQ